MVDVCVCGKDTMEMGIEEIGGRVAMGESFSSGRKRGVGKREEEAGEGVNGGREKEIQEKNHLSCVTWCLFFFSMVMGDRETAMERRKEGYRCSTSSHIPRRPGLSINCLL